MGGCQRCGRCCTSFGVCVTPFDIARISAATGMEPGKIAMIIPEPPKRKRAEPAILISGKRCLVVLCWSDETRRCMFYSISGCIAYAARPMLCRTYPFLLKAGGLESVCSRACPRRWKPDDEAAYAADCRQYEKEVAAYRSIAAEWNSGKGGTFREFLSFSLERAGGQGAEG